MSVIGKETIGSSIKGEVPPQDGQEHPIDMNILATATPSFKVRNGDEDKKFHSLKMDAEWVLNMEKFFDEPVWREVLGKLKKKTDIENCSNASLFFGELLQEERERKVVLPTVFEILGKCYWTRKYTDDSYFESKVESIPWQLPPNRKEPNQMTGLWKCRLVCKKWNEAIEEIHRNEDSGYNQMEYSYYSCYSVENYKFCKFWGKDEFRRESRVVKFLDHFEATHYDSFRQVAKKCPFFGRCIKINVDVKDVENNPAYFDRLKEMLRRFGREVWYFTIYYYSNRTTENHVFLYQKTKDMVEMMSDLKLIRINYMWFILPSKEELQALGEEIERNPFPKLRSLETFSAHDIPGTFFNHLVNQNRQISTLEMLEIKFDGYCKFMIEEIPNLRQLVLDVSSIEVLEAFENYPFTLTLEKLHFRYRKSLTFVAWSRILDAIGSKLNPDSCRDLQLVMPTPETDAEKKSVLEDSLYCRLGLSNLQRIDVDCFSRYCVDFLLASKHSLRDLRLNCFISFEDGEYKKYQDEQVVLFLGYEINSDRSNVHKQFSSLKKLKIGVIEIPSDMELEENEEEDDYYDDSEDSQEEKEHPDYYYEYEY